MAESETVLPLRDKHDGPPTFGALEVSRRWLAVGTDTEGHVVRYGPFLTKEDAEEYISQRWDYDYEAVEMHDVSLLEAAMSAWLIDRHPGSITK